MEIHVLSSETINRIAAGEVVEKPVNVVKELTENAIDAGASAITIEIKNGGIDLIRVTDNGCGIEPSQITKAFMRHATSKIRDEQDLSSLVSLGFRGEALSSIAAVAQVELITKTRENMIGIRATNENVLPDMTSGLDALAASDQAMNHADSVPSRQDVIPLKISEVGAPDGTSGIVRNIFYNVPVRKKFLKSPQTEAGYITDLVEQLALSHPDISFHYRVNNQEKLHTTGNGNEKELIYRIYGREMAGSVIPIDTDADTLAEKLTALAENNAVIRGAGMISVGGKEALLRTAESLKGSGYRLHGYLGRPEFSRSSRSNEIFFVNSRILKSDVLSRALEEGYRTDLMQHRFPFAILHLDVPAQDIDVNVHPSKMEVRFSEAKRIYDFINEAVHETLHRIELIPRASADTMAEENARRREEEKQRELAEKQVPHLEIFEQAAASSAASAQENAKIPAASAFKEPAAVYESEDFVFTDRRKPQQMTLFEEQALPAKKPFHAPDENHAPDEKPEEPAASSFADTETQPDNDNAAVHEKYEERDLNERIFTKENVRQYRIIGQAFDTYWIVEFNNDLLLIDQHAAHEKVNFERLMARLTKETEEAEAAGHAPSQLIAPPIIVNLTGKEEAAYLSYADVFTRMGYEIEEFGSGSYAIRAVPMELYANEPDALLREIIDEILAEKMSGTPAAILYKIASMSCKAAVKGNMKLSLKEAEALIDELLQLDNPYHCPHGRPTMIIMSKQEMERKFKRIV